MQKNRKDTGRTYVRFLPSARYAELLSHTVVKVMLVKRHVVVAWYLPRKETHLRVERS